MYVRPEIFATSAAISSAVNFLIGLVPLTVVLLIYGKSPGIKSPLILIFLIAMTLFITGVGLLLATAYLSFDDSRSIANILILGTQYATPVFYPITALGVHTQNLINLNPLTSYLQVFRSIYGDNAESTANEWLMMTLSAITLFVFGLYLFGRNWHKLVARL